MQSEDKKMKFVAKRWFSILLALIMCFSLVLNVNMLSKADYVDYVTSGGYIYNWGNRGEIATFLSQNAEGFYEDNNTSYEELASLTGSSNKSNVPSSALYNELQDLMESNHSNITNYNETRDLYQYTDCQNSGKTSKKISSFYSGKEIGPSWDSGSTWNREHTWPNSKGLEGSDENDIMMLRPTAVSENSSRGNTAYGESTGYYDPNSVSGGKYNLHGDVARIMLYQYVRWGNTGNMWGTSGVMESVEVLLDWIEEDPVDTWELGRNDSVEAITGTRNVFVDYPELAFVLFDADIPADYATPSGNADSVQYTITAQSNNTLWGTVSVSGKVVNATAQTGYEVSGYEIISGTATVTRSGNTFTVSATSDVVIRINFAARSQKTISFSENDNLVDTQTVYGGDVITLPSNTIAADEGTAFVGWIEKSLDETTKIPQYYTAGSKYTVTSNVTLYALYSKNVNDGGSSSNVFEKYNGALTEGDYIFTYEGGAMKAAATDKNRLQIATADDSGNEMTVTDDLVIWHIAKDGNYWTIYNASTGKYAGGTGVKNTAKLLDSVDDFAKWTATGNGTYEFVNLGNDAKGVNPLLRRNGDVGFACYAKNTTVGGALTLYKRVSGTVYYFTSTSSVCAHDYNSDCDTTCSLCNEHRIVYSVHTLNSSNVCIDCGVELQSFSTADIDNDGKINPRDYIIIVRYLNGWDVEFPLNAADVNGDGKVNGRDCMILMQYINGWDVEIPGIDSGKEDTTEPEKPVYNNQGPLVFF